MNPEKHWRTNKKGFFTLFYYDAIDTDKCSPFEASTDLK